MLNESLKVLITLALFIGSGESILKRCYSCRSRGDQGDCRDPFYFSSSTPVNASLSPADIEDSTGIKTVPCASGWCSKTIEGVDKSFKDFEYGRATQRGCLQRSLSDDRERCAYVTLKHKRVYMCFCQGDLCNGGPSFHATSYFVLGGTSLISIFILNRFH